MKLLLFRNLLLDISLWIPLLIYEVFDLAVADLQHPLDDIRSGSDDMLDIVLADLIIEFFEDFFCING
jgi:hypothetical protein